MDKLPKISIVTVVLNCVELIEKTICSVINLEYENIEYLIIDGGSIDGTLAIIEKYKSSISWWVSEPDKGIYNAMNKGVAHAKGDFICFVNAGDEILEIPHDVLSNNENSIICFPVLLSSGEVVNPSFNKSIKLRNTLPHQGCFYKKCSHLVYDIRYYVFADFALNQKYFKLGLNVQILSEPIIAKHNIGGISHDKKYEDEIFKIVKDNFGYIIQLKSWIYFKIQGAKLYFKNIFLHGS